MSTGELFRNVPETRRTTRTHGERKQDREARRNFEYEQKNKPVEPIGEPVYIKPCCVCKKKPYPHLSCQPVPKC